MPQAPIRDEKVAGDHEDDADDDREKCNVPWSRRVQAASPDVPEPRSPGEGAVSQSLGMTGPGVGALPAAMAATSRLQDRVPRASEVLQERLRVDLLAHGAKKVPTEAEMERGAYPPAPRHRAAVTAAAASMHKAKAAASARSMDVEGRLTGAGGHGKRAASRLCSLRARLQSAGCRSQGEPLSHKHEPDRRRSMRAPRGAIGCFAGRRRPKDRRRCRALQCFRHEPSQHVGSNFCIGRHADALNYNSSPTRPLHARRHALGFFSFRSLTRLGPGDSIQGKRSSTS